MKKTQRGPPQTLQVEFLQRESSLEVIEFPGEINELQDVRIVIQWNGLSVSKENYGQITKAPKGGVLLKGIRRGQKGRKKKRKGEETGSGAEPRRNF